MAQAWAAPRTPQESRNDLLSANCHFAHRDVISGVILVFRDISSVRRTLLSPRLSHGDSDPVCLTKPCIS